MAGICVRGALALSLLGLALAGAAGPAISANAPEPADPSLYDRPVLVLEPGMHTAPIRRIGLDAAGHFLVSASDDKTVRVWSAEDGRLLQTIRLPAGPGNIGKTRAVAVSPDGATIAAGGWARVDDHDVYLFERRSGRLQLRIGGLPGVVNHLAFAPDGHSLVAALGGRNGVRLFDRATGALLAEDRDYGDGGYGAAFAPDGRLATTSDDGQIRLYDRALYRLAKVAAPGGQYPYSLAFAPDGRRLAVGYYDTTRVDVLDGHTLAPLFAADTPRSDRGNLGIVTWSADGATLFAGGVWPGDLDIRLLRWDQGGQGRRAGTWIARDTLMDLRPLADGRLAFGAQDPSLGLLGQDSTVRWRQDPSRADFRGQEEVLAVAADGSRFAFGYKPWGQEPATFDLRARALRLGGAGEPGLAVASTSAPGLEVINWQHRLHPTVNGQSLTLDPFEMSRSLAIAPDGERFVLGADWSLRLFDRSGRELWRKNLPGTAWAVNVTGDGRLVVAAYGDGTIRWHKLEDGEELLAFMPLADRQRWVVWTPEGYYASSPDTGSILGWHVNRGWDQAADFYPITAYAGYYQPQALPLVLQELETPRALGLAKMAYDRKLVQEAVDSPVPPGPQLHVLTVGVSDYAHDERLRLDFADDDARDLATKLLAQEGAGLYAKVNLWHRLDEPPTQRSFFAALRKLRDAMQPDQRDVAVIHFSGHGMQVDGELYLLPSDVEAVDDPDAIVDTAIGHRRLKEVLGRLGERGKVLVLLDACHSGGMAESIRDVLPPPDVEAVRAELAAAGPGVIVLTSSTGQEVSVESPDWQNGAFTEAVLEALAGRGDRNGDRWLSVSELEDHVVRRVRELTGNRQNPRIAVVGEHHFVARLFVTGL